jgi:hypothetical protein
MPCRAGWICARSIRVWNLQSGKIVKTIQVPGAGRRST